MQNKWKTVKASARRRDQLIRKSLSKTGGGFLSTFEKKIVESSLYSDVASKLGISAHGNEPRFDSDATLQSNANITPPTQRLQNAINNENASTSEQQEEINDDDDDGVGTPLSESTTNLSTTTEVLCPIPSISSISPSSSQDLDTMKKRNTLKDAQFENLNQQRENNEIYNKYLQLQVERSQFSKDREMIRLKMAKIELEKVEALRNIEIDKQKQLAQLEIDAKRRDLNM